MADEIVRSGEPVPNKLDVLRALNPNHLVGGLPTEQHFIMKKNRLNDGISTCIEVLIPLEELRRLEVLASNWGQDFAVAVINVGEALEPVRETLVQVLQQDDPRWGPYSHAHAAITGYSLLTNRQIEDFGRYLAKLARQRFYPKGSATLGDANQ